MSGSFTYLKKGSIWFLIIWNKYPSFKTECNCETWTEYVINSSRQIGEHQISKYYQTSRISWPKLHPETWIEHFGIDRMRSINQFWLEEWERVKSSEVWGHPLIFSFSFLCFLIPWFQAVTYYGSLQWVSAGDKFWERTALFSVWWQLWFRKGRGKLHCFLLVCPPNVWLWQVWL